MTHSPEKLPFRDLPRDDKAVILMAIFEDHNAEYLRESDGTWVHLSIPVHVNTNMIYRIAPPKPQPATIDWSQVALGWNDAAMDISGEWWLFAGNVRLNGRIWAANISTRAEAFASFRPGTMPFAESRISRPGVMG